MIDALTAALLRDMRAEAAAALNLVREADNRTIGDDPILSRALALSLILVGEAAAQMPESVKQAHPLLPWNQARALRNRIVHGYRTIVPDILIETARNDLPELIADLDRLLADEGEQTHDR